MTTRAGESPAVEFARLLAWAYRGEVAGATLFDTLADTWTNDGHTDSLRVLADLERRMALALVARLARHEVDGGDDERSRRSGRESAAAIAQGSWDEFLAQFTPATDAALVRYHRLQSLASDRDPTFDVLIAHEEALQAFGLAEMRGDHVHALEPVHAVIARLAAAERV